MPPSLRVYLQRTSTARSPHLEQLLGDPPLHWRDGISAPEPLPAQRNPEARTALCSCRQLSPSKALSTRVVSAAWVGSEADARSMQDAGRSPPQPQERLSRDFHGGGDSQDSGGKRSADSHRAPFPLLLIAHFLHMCLRTLHTKDALKRCSIIALRILEFKRSNSDVWAQKSPPEGDACFSASSTQGLLGRRQRPRQRLLPVLQFLPPWKFQAPARQEKEASRAPGFQEASMRGAQGREGQDQ